MSFKELKRFLISNFLASADIKAFGRTYIFTMPAASHFFTPRMFLLSININKHLAMHIAITEMLEVLATYN